MIKEKILFNKLVLFTAELMLSQSIEEGVTNDPYHKKIVAGINAYKYVGRFTQEEADYLMELGKDPYMQKLRKVPISLVVYALEMLKLWVNEVSREDRKNIHIGVSSKKLKIGPAVFVMDMLKLKRKDEAKYLETSAIISESKVTAKKFFSYSREKIKEKANGKEDKQ